MWRGLRRGRWTVLSALLCAGCATPLPQGDHWGVRRIAGRTPAVVSLSEVNPGQPAATRPLQAVLLRTATRGENVVAVHVGQVLAPTWRAVAERVEPELQGALDWLERIDAEDPRGLHLDVTLVGPERHRRERRRHPAGDLVRVDLVVPTAHAPASRSASIARALAIALHETVHALRDDTTSRADDEYRASLVESCFLLDVVRSGDVVDLAGGGSDASGGAPGVEAAPVDRGSGKHQPRAAARGALAIGNAAGGDAATADFTARHSREAAARVLADLRRVAGTSRIGSADHGALRRVRAFCHQDRRGPARR